MGEDYNYIYKIQPNRPEMLTKGPTVEEEKILENHFTYLKNLTKKGIVFLAGRTQTADISGFGIVIFKADSENSALDLMNNDPAVKSGVMRAELYPYKIACLYKTG